MSERNGNVRSCKYKHKPSRNANDILQSCEGKFEANKAKAEFQIVENDFPSLLNCGEGQSTPVDLGRCDINEHSKTLTISYSAKLLTNNQASISRSLLQPSHIRIGLQSCGNETGEEAPFSIKKKRKRKKKKPKTAITTDSVNASNDVNTNVQIDLEDPEEYPTLGASSTQTKLFENVIPSKTAVSKELSKQKVPGIIKIDKEAIKTPTKSTRKKANTPVQINIFDVLTKPQKQAKVKAKKTSVPTTFNVRKAKVNFESKIYPHNVLDSSAPMRKRGKEREKPKAKITKMRKVILQERLLKKQQRSISKTTQIDSVAEVAENLQNLDVSTAEDVETNEIVHNDSQMTLDVKKEIVVDVSDEHNEENKPRDDDSSDETMACIKKIVHTRKYRDYCNQRLSQEIDSTLESLLIDLVRFQDRLFQKDPIKAKIRKRMVFGLKEVIKNIKLNRVKVVIIAPDIEQIASQGGLNDAICNLTKLCEENSILVIFGLPRRKLGYVCKKAVPVSCIGIISYEGKEDLFRKLVEFVMEARASYQLLIEQIEKQLNKEMKMFILNSDLNNKQLQEMKKTILIQASQSC